MTWFPISTPSSRSAKSRPQATFGLPMLAVVLFLSACGESTSDLAPQLLGKRLDLANSDLKAAGVEQESIEVIGGGTFGALDESNWTVCDQEPEAGTELSNTVRLLIDRTCTQEDTFEALASPEPEADEGVVRPEADLSPTASPAGPPPEVKVDKCVKEGIEVIASGTIRNTDTVSRTFAVAIEFYDKGGAKIEEGTDFLSVEAGQTARWQQDNFTEETYTLGDCKVVSVS